MSRAQKILNMLKEDAEERENSSCSNLPAVYMNRSVIAGKSSIFQLS